MSKIVSSILTRGWQIRQLFARRLTTFWSHCWRAGGLWQLWKLEAKKKVARQNPPIESIEGGVGQHRKNEKMSRRKEKWGKWKITVVLNVKRSLYESQ